MGSGLAACCFSVILSLVALANPSRRIASSGLQLPRDLRPTDYQTAEDVRLMIWFQKVDQNQITKVVDAHLLKPLVQDLSTRQVAMEGIEVTEGQCPQLNAAIDTCVRILHSRKKPRVFLSAQAKAPICTLNASEPIIVIDSSICSRFRDPAELRFLIGRELGHIQAGHVRWLSLVRVAQKLSAKVGSWGSFGMPDGSSVLLPFLQWARASEMSADNAGCICAQDAAAVERALVRLATGVESEPGIDVNADSYLRQVENGDLSKASELVLLFEQLSERVPFAPDRIRQVRQYQLSRRYHQIWKRE